MAFRSRLAALLLIVVAVPLIAGAVAIERMARGQAQRDAGLSLQVASLSATEAFRREGDAVERAVTAPFAVRAFEARNASALGALRRGAGLDYLIVSKGGRPVMSSIAVPVAATPTAAAIDQGALRPVAAEHRVVIRNREGASVLGGRLWQPPSTAGLGVTTTLILRGAPMAPAGTHASAVVSHDLRVVCLCSGGSGGNAGTGSAGGGAEGADRSGLLLTAPAAPGGLSRFAHWPWVGFAGLMLAALIALAYGVAWLLARPLTRLAQNAAAIARGENGVVVVPDPGADREINQVMGSLRSVSEELDGSRSELARARGQLVDTERMVLVDPLTGVWNRRYLDRALNEQTKRYARYRRPFALLVIDVDQFKRVNDAHGHPAGDIVLRGIAQLIQGSIRADLDVLARFGGEEFVAVLPDTDAAGGWSAAEKIRTLVERSRFDAGGASVSVTVSIGVSACPKDGDEFERLLHAADSALYRAKEAGRNASVSASVEHVAAASPATDA